MMGAKMALTDHGSQQRETLADLARILALGVEIAARTKAPNKDGLHQCVHEVTRMAQDGGRWDSEWAHQLHTGLEVAAELLADHTDLAIYFMPAASRFSDDILHGRDMAGAIVPFDEALAA